MGYKDLVLMFTDITNELSYLDFRTISVQSRKIDDIDIRYLLERMGDIKNK